MCSVWALGVAQTPDSAALRGEIKGPNGAWLSGVQVTIEDSQQCTVCEVHTGSHGSFVADDLPAERTLVVLAAYPGFAEARSCVIVLAAGSTAILQLSMQVATARVEVHVTGEADEVRSDEPQLGDRLTPSYVYSHALDTVDPDVPSQNPNDPLRSGEAELGNAIFDQRHRVVVSGVYAARFEITAGGITRLASGLPYNIVTGVTNSGDTGATTDRPVIDGAVVGRNSGRGTPIYDVSLFVGKRVALGSDRLHANLRAEAFNALNHRNVVGFSGTYGNGVAPGVGFGAPLAGVTNQLPARELQFSAQFQF